MEPGSCFNCILQVQGVHSNTSIFLQILLILILVVVNGFFSASEMAIVTLNPNKVQKWVDEGKKNAKTLQNFLQNESNFLATIQIGVTFAGFLSAAFGADKLAPHLIQLLDPRNQYVWMDTLATIIITLIISFLSLVFGELIPKRIGMAYPEQYSLRFAKLLHFFDIAFKPISKILSKSVDAISQLVGLTRNTEKDNITENDIRLMTELGRIKGSIQGEEAAMISNVFSLDDISVAEIMTPRTAVEALDVNISWAELQSFVKDTSYSRFPVYEEEIDKIIGILHLRDLFQSLPQTEEDFDLRRYLRPAYFVPESKSINILMKEMSRGHITQAVVIDEYGGVDGIVSMEDIVEELVGEIEDEFDAQPLNVIKNEDGSYDFSGLLAIDDAAQYIPELSEYTEGDYDTVAGLALSYLKCIPKEGESPEFNLGKLHVKVLSMDGRRISYLRIYPAGYEASK